MKPRDVFLETKENNLVSRTTTKERKTIKNGNNPVSMIPWLEKKNQIQELLSCSATTTWKIWTEKKKVKKKAAA